MDNSINAFWAKLDNGRESVDKGENLNEMLIDMC